MEIIPHHSGSSGNVYEIKGENTRIVIDAGVPFKAFQKALRFDLHLDGILLTHTHKDHAHCIKDCLFWNIPIYMTKGSKEELKLEVGNFHIFEKCNTFYQKVKIKDFEILPIPTHHDTKEPVGFYIKELSTGEDLLFMIDTAKILIKVSNCTYYMLECNYVDHILDENGINERLKSRVRDTHFALSSLLSYLKSIKMEKTKHLYLMHLSDNNSDKIEIEREVKQVVNVPITICQR